MQSVMFTRRVSKVALSILMTLVLAVSYSLPASIFGGVKTAQAYEDPYIYAYLCCPSGDESNCTLVLSSTTPTGYGKVLKKYDECVSTLGSTSTQNLLNNKWVYISAASGWPWYEDSDSITAVAATEEMELDFTMFMFASLSNCKEFDLSGFSVYNYGSDTMKNYLDANYTGFYFMMFGNYTGPGVVNNTGWIESVVYIKTGDTWNLHFFDSSYNCYKTSTYQTVYALSTGESYTNNYTLPTGADTYYLSETDYNLAKNSQVVEKPMSIEGLDEYESGTTEQTVSISSNEYYTVSGCTSATEDGIYTFTLSLNDKYDAETNTTGYVWSDGTTDDVTYMWYIGEATAASDEELSALSTALTSAQSALAEIQTSITAGDVVLSEDGSDVLPANKWISQAALNAAQAAIDAAGGVADSTHVTAATSALTTATAALVAADGTHVHSYTTELTERTVDATCTETGEKTMQCSCGATQTETISATGHTAGAEATCTTAQVCTVCKAELKAATGHTAGAAATCTTAQVCTVCNAELAAATGHTAGAAATCTTAQVCTVCNAELTAATGHNWVKGVCTNNCGTDGKAQAITVKASTSKTYKGTKNIKKKKLKKAQTFTISASATGAVSFKKVSSTSSKISINSKGKVTVKKGLKAGTYTLKAKVSAAASGEYKAASKTITIKVVVKKK